MEKRVIGYARVSTEKQDLERQKNLIKSTVLIEVMN